MDRNEKTTNVEYHDRPPYPTENTQAPQPQPEMHPPYPLQDMQHVPHPQPEMHAASAPYPQAAAQSWYGTTTGSESQPPPPYSDVQGYSQLPVDGKQTGYPPVAGPPPGYPAYPPGIYQPPANYQPAANYQPGVYQQVNYQGGNASLMQQHPVTTVVIGNQENLPSNSNAICLACCVVFLCSPLFGCIAFLIAYSASSQQTRDQAQNKINLSNKISILGIVIGTFGFMFGCYRIYVMMQHQSDYDYGY